MQKIECDCCGKDVTYTGKMPAFRIHLESQALPHLDSMVYAVLVHPEIKGDLYFCSVACLEGWLTKRAADKGQA